MFKKTVLLFAVLFFDSGLHAGFNSRAIGAPQEECVAEQELVAAIQLLPIRSLAAIAQLNAFEECMQTTLGMMSHNSGVKKSQALSLWHGIQALATLDGCETSCFYSDVRENGFVFAAVRYHALAIQNFCKNKRIGEEHRRLVKALYQEGCSCDQAQQREGSDARDNELENFQESVLFLIRLSLLAREVEKAVPGINGMTRAQLTKKLWDSFAEPISSNHSELSLSDVCL
ncbi:hypothetical protein CVU75_02765 [Candidatus Dependentiae bacterium HGW-Dependentiae-1]|nr:MAG: hypothetical protein CVU75_02765 [Candidatus Dependentiae bacterium HGW-Dependentiae-1]